MIKNLKAWTVSVLLLGLSFAFSRQKSNEDRLKFKSSVRA